jgi:hypothetical protein
VGGKKGSKIEIVEYYMTIHYGIAAALDEIRAIIINEKEAWSGSVTDYTVIDINKPELFGGPKKEGGATGQAHYLPGNAAQVLPDFLAAKMGLTSDKCPAYRGISSLFFTGNGDSGGFHWTSNTPYINGTWVVARRAPKVLDASNRMIDGNDANVVHVIYEAMTNPDWGIGASPSAFNVDTWLSAAQTIYDEKIGVSLLWTEQQAVEDFSSQMLSYIDGLIFVNPRNGLLEIKLIRNDYDPNTIPELDDSNCKVTNYQRKLWGETVNEVVVTWTNPESEEKETVSVQDLANIAMQGGVVSDSNNYEAVRKSDIAMKLATRDLRAASAPLMSCIVTADRKQYDITPGSVFKLTNRQHGMQEVIMRAGPVDYGKIGDSSITIQCMEDIFSLDSQDYITPPSTSWTDPTQLPAPLAYTLPFTLPYFVARNVADDALLASMQPGQVLVGLLGAQPGSDTHEFVLSSMGADPLGNPVIVYGTSLGITSRGTITTPLIFEVESTTTVIGLTQGDTPEVGFLVVMGTTDENMEICVIRARAGSNLTLLRGALDTIPRAWPVGTPIWIVANDAVIDEETIYQAGQDVLWRPLTITSRGRLAYADAVGVGFETTNRPWLPNRPANFKIEGSALAEVNAVGQTSVTLTWANRNRVMEDAIVLDWDDATVDPEDGQTTTALIIDPATGNVVNRVEGLTGVTYELSTGDFAGLTRGIVRLVATRDGLDSLQGHEISVLVNGGYGYAYGFDYGSPD